MHGPTAQTPSDAAAAYPAMRRADRIPQIRQALAVVRVAGTLASSPIRQPAREPFEADGPATCLI